MPEYATSRRVKHSATNMFDLVADVERYPEFVPLCDAMHVLRRDEQNGHEVITAKMTIAYKLIRESFTTRVRLERDNSRILVSYIDGPFKYLENSWSFKAIDGDRCEIGFSLSYEFRSRLLQAVMGAVFDQAFRKFADAFEARADEIYGPRKAGLDPSAAPAGCGS
ncbi:MAG TPA: type II toxin-antitoxin system RatA family toxin [Hyphomicrobiales bacterium]|nr:type II toxin-antitoxin system RatA family toxin [Hyphomicrobiales bacterium]